MSFLDFCENFHCIVMGLYIHFYPSYVIVRIYKHKRKKKYRVNDNKLLEANPVILENMKLGK